MSTARRLEAVSSSFHYRRSLKASTLNGMSRSSVDDGQDIRPVLSARLPSIDPGANSPKCCSSMLLAIRLVPLGIRRDTRIETVRLHLISCERPGVYRTPKTSNIEEAAALSLMGEPYENVLTR